MGHVTEAEIAAFCAVWCAAEDSLKDVEGELLRLPQQPINELRYATRHFARAITAADPVKAREEYAAAIRHCTCAAYDTAEAVLVFRFLRFKSFQEDFKGIAIATPVFDYKAALLAYRSAQKAISRDPKARHERREQVQAACASLSVFDESLDDARDELNKAVAKERRTRRQWVAVFAVIAITALGTCAGAYAAFARPNKSGAPSVSPSATDAPKPPS